MKISVEQYCRSGKVPSFVVGCVASSRNPIPAVSPAPTPTPAPTPIPAPTPAPAPS